MYQKTILNWLVYVIQLSFCFIILFIILLDIVQLISLYYIV